MAQKWLRNIIIRAMLTIGFEPMGIIMAVFNAAGGSDNCDLLNDLEWLVISEYPTSDCGEEADDA